MGRISLYISVLMLLCSCVYDYEPKDEQGADYVVENSKSIEDTIDIIMGQIKKEM